MKVGSVWNPGNVVGPMITDKNDKLLKALELEKGSPGWFHLVFLISINMYWLLQ